MNETTKKGTQPIAPAETSQQRDLVLCMRHGRGRLGGSTLLDLLIQLGRAAGRSVLVGDGDRGNPTLSTLYPPGSAGGATRPKSDEVPDVKEWISDCVGEGWDGIERTSVYRRSMMRGLGANGAGCCVAPTVRYGGKQSTVGSLNPRHGGRPTAARNRHPTIDATREEPRRMNDGYMKEQGEALAQHLRLTDGRSGYVEATADNFVVYVRKKWPGKQLTEWDGLPVEWHENVGTNKAANR